MVVVEPLVCQAKAGGLSVSVPMFHSARGTSDVIGPNEHQGRGDNFMEPGMMVLEQGNQEANVIQEIMHGLRQMNAGLSHVMEHLLKAAENCPNQEGQGSCCTDCISWFMGGKQGCRAGAGGTKEGAQWSLGQC